MERKNKKQMRMVLLAGILLVLFSNLICAANIGISPARATFSDVLRGGYAERIIIVSADSNEPIMVHLKPRGDIADWINYSGQNFTVSKNNPYPLKLSISPSIDIPNGDYTGFLRFEMGNSPESIEEHAVGTIKSTLDLAISVGVTDVEIIRCSVSDVRISSAEEGDDVILVMNVTNEGNVRLKPDVSLDVWDFDKISVVNSESFIGNEILPSTERQLEFRFNSAGFSTGQYWSDAYVPDCLYSGTFTFDILEHGALSANAILLSILTPGHVNVGDTTIIKANFKNTGEKEIEARFRGQVTKDGKIVDLLESEILKVPISSVNEFDFYFTPKSVGKYIITGRVFYEGKKTFEMSSTLEAIGSSFSYMWLAYVLVIAVIGFLFYKIRKEKRIYLSKLRKIK